MTDYEYRCSTGHWVRSSRLDMEDENCPAQYDGPGQTASRYCAGKLGAPSVSGYEYADLLEEVERLRVQLSAAAAAACDECGDGSAKC